MASMMKAAVMRPPRRAGAGVHAMGRSRCDGSWRATYCGKIVAQIGNRIARIFTRLGEIDLYFSEGIQPVLALRRRFQHALADAFCLGCGKGGVVNIGAAVPCGDGFVFRVFRAAAKVGIAADIRLPKWRATQSRFSPAKRAWLELFAHSTYPVRLPSLS